MDQVNVPNQNSGFDGFQRGRVLFLDKGEG